MTDGTIHWEGTPPGVCPAKDDGRDERTVTQANGTSITFMARATHAANVTCPTCSATPSFREAKARQDAYWAGEEADAREVLGY